jgi:peptidoglycan/LPS O-acetylase OafA/YrhL
MIAKKEIRSLTGIRGVAAVYVVVHHYLIGVAMTNPVTTFLAHGYLAVDLFFILSGFVMALNYAHLFAAGWSLSSYVKFLGRRVARVYPLYLVGTLCGFILVVLGWLEPLHFRSILGNLFANIFMVQAWGYGPSFDGPAWSISSEWAAYLIFPLLLVPTLFKKPILSGLSAIFAIAILALLSTVPAHSLHNAQPNAVLDLHDSWAAIPVLRCVVEFTLGLVAYRVANTPFVHRITRKSFVSIAVAVAALALLMIPRADLWFVLLMPLLIISLASGDHLPQKLLSSGPVEYLGLLSYSIYLVHDLLGGFIAALHHQANVHHLAHGQTFAAAICFVLTFPLAWLSFRFIENPGRRWLRYLFEKGSREPRGALDSGDQAQDGLDGRRSGPN